MSRADRSVAMTADVDRLARQHLLRPDRQEDICFGLWRSSKGQTRTTALLERLLLPREGKGMFTATQASSRSFWSVQWPKRLLVMQDLPYYTATPWGADGKA